MTVLLNIVVLIVAWLLWGHVGFVAVAAGLAMAWVLGDIVTRHSTTWLNVQGFVTKRYISVWNVTKRYIKHMRTL